MKRSPKRASRASARGARRTRPPSRLPGGRAVALACIVALVSGCASLPETSPSDITLYDDVGPLNIEMTPMVESPPISVSLR